jgi:hypothetical protein
MSYQPKRTGVRLVALAVLVAVPAAVFLVDWDPERTRREAFIYHCNEEGAAGVTFTSREYCEALYARSKATQSQNSN